MPNKQGIATTYILVFGAILLLLLGGLLSFVLTQLRISSQQIARKQALQIAEAGANYYHWCLNNEAQQDCVSQRPVADLSGNKLGTSSMDLASLSYCGSTTAQTISSVGYAKEYPQLKREVEVLYGRESVVKFSYLLDSKVWAGSDRVIKGRYHSNKGIRMDGENQSVVSSAVEGTWTCTDICEETNFYDCPQACAAQSDGCECPGVFTTTDNANPELFETSPRFQFDSIMMDLRKIKDKAIQKTGQYWPPVSEKDSQGEAYHIVLNGDSFEVRIITDLEYPEDHFVIDDEYTYATSSPNSECPVIFVEDDLWLEGTVKDKITVASADFSASSTTNIILPGNIKYAEGDNSSGITTIAENNILISADSPPNMILNGIFVAKDGHFGRNNYWRNFRDSLEIYGSIVSRGRVGTQWISRWGHVVSGYLERENYIDSNLLYEPPPFTPFVTDQFEQVYWKEIE